MECQGHEYSRTLDPRGSGGRHPPPARTHRVLRSSNRFSNVQALQFYTEKLGFEKRMDFTVGLARWLTVAPKGSAGPEIVLHNPRAWHSTEEAEEMLAQVGKTPGMILGTQNCREEREAAMFRVQWGAIRLGEHWTS